MDLAQAQIAARNARCGTSVQASAPALLLGCGLVLCTALSAGVTGCSGGPTTILESDVPLVAGTQVRQSTDIHLRGGELLSGRAICFGAMEDAKAAMKQTDSRFADHGWAVLRRTESRDRIETIYFKGARRADVLVEFNSIDPEMSRATIAVTSTTSAASPTAPANPSLAEPPTAQP